MAEYEQASGNRFLAKVLPSSVLAPLTLAPRKLRKGPLQVCEWIDCCGYRCRSIKRKGRSNCGPFSYLTATILQLMAGTLTISFAQ
jgi:hypothetical protein